MTLTTLATSADWTAIVAAIGIAVSIVMQLLKPLIETIPAFDPANTRAYRDEAHNAILRILSGVLTYAGVLAIAVQMQPLTSQLALAVLAITFPGAGVSFLSFKSGQKIAAKLAPPAVSVAGPPPVPNIIGPHTFNSAPSVVSAALTSAVVPPSPPPSVPPLPSDPKPLPIPAGGVLPVASSVVSLSTASSGPASSTTTTGASVQAGNTAGGAVV